MRAFAAIYSHGTLRFWQFTDVVGFTTGFSSRRDVGYCSKTVLFETILWTPLEGRSAFSFPCPIHLKHYSASMQSFSSLGWKYLLASYAKCRGAITLYREFSLSNQKSWTIPLFTPLLLIGTLPAMILWKRPCTSRIILSASALYVKCPHATVTLGVEPWLMRCCLFSSLFLCKTKDRRRLSEDMYWIQFPPSSGKMIAACVAGKPGTCPASSGSSGIGISRFRS